MTTPPDPADEPAKSPTAPLPQLGDAFPEASDAVRELAEADAEPAEPTHEPDPVPAPRPRRTGEGLRGSDEFVRGRARATAHLPELDPAPAGDAEAEARAAAALARRWEAAAAQAEDALRIAGTMLPPLEQRVAAIRVGLDLAARAPEDREWRLGTLPPDVQQLMRGIVARVHADAQVARRLQVALFQFGDAQRSAAALRERLARAAELPPAEGLEFLAKIEVPKVKGKLYVVANFANVFRGDPVIGRLFPPRGGTAPTGPAAAEPAPAAPPAAPPGARAPTSPNPGTANLREAWEAVRSALGKRRPG